MNLTIYSSAQIKNLTWLLLLKPELQNKPLLLPGFPTGVESMGGSSLKFDGRGSLSQYMRGAWGAENALENAFEIWWNSFDIW